MDRISKTEDVMKKCEVCGHTVFHQENVDEFFRIDGDTMLVEQVPAQV